MRMGLTLSIAFLTAVQPLAWSLPQEVLLHGVVTDSSGAPLNGTRAYQVTFYDAETGGAIIGSSLAGTADLSGQGVLSVPVALPPGALIAAEVWYELGVDTDVPADNDASDDVFPERVRLYSVPFALQSATVQQVDADRVGQGSVDDAEFDALDGVTGNIQDQLDAIDLSGIQANADDIAVLQSDVTQNSSDIGTLQTDLLVQGNELTDLQTDLGALENEVIQNTSDIGLIESDLSSVQNDVAQNAADIALKANAADVYTTAAADAAFVEAAGDAMSGALTINDTTASVDKDSGALVVEGGVGIEQDVNVSGTLAVPSVVVPDTTNPPGDITARLYNNGGNLFWNGIQIDAQTLDKDALNNAGTLSFEWSDAEVSDAVSIGSGGSVHTDAFSAADDLAAEGAIGSGANQVAAGNHSHNLEDLGGAVSDAQVANALTIQGGSINADSFSAIDDLVNESAIGSGALQVAAGNHSHLLQDLGGAVTDAQVPNALTIQGGTVNDDSFSAYSDLGTEGRRNNDDPGDLLTRGQADLLYAPAGGSAVEIWDVFANGTLPELVLSGTSRFGANLLHDTNYPQHIWFPNQPAQKVVTQIQIYIIRYLPFAGDRAVSLAFEVRDIITGAVAHTITTAPVNLISSPEYTWITLSLDSNAANRTIEISEFLAGRATVSGTDSGQGELEIRIRAAVQ